MSIVSKTIINLNDLNESFLQRLLIYIHVSKNDINKCYNNTIKNNISNSLKFNWYLNFIHEMERELRKGTKTHLKLKICNKFLLFFELGINSLLVWNHVKLH